MTNHPHSTEEREHVLSERFLRELAEILERMWQPIRNGQSDLREWEQQIRGLARREVKAARQSAEAALEYERFDAYVRGIGHVANDLLRHDRELTLERVSQELAKLEAERLERLAKLRTALNIPNGGNDV